MESDVKKTSISVLGCFAFTLATACAGSSAQRADSLVSALAPEPTPAQEPGAAATAVRTCTLEDLVAAGYQQDAQPIREWLAARCVPADEDTFVMGLLAGSTPAPLASSNEGL